jgi:VanZ family protein
MGGLVRWLARWWPTLLWAAVISVFSTHYFTADNTSRIIMPVLHWMFPHASADMLAEMHHYIRKAGHFTEYFILSLLILRAIRDGLHTTKFAWALIIALVAGYASLDEFHQSFVPGRTAAITDVLLDTTGGIAAQLVAALLLLWAHVRGRQRTEE